MHPATIPFQITDWQHVPRTEHPGDTGMAYWQTRQFGNLRVRLVTYSADYQADHWCQRGHILYIIEGELDTQLADGRVFRLTAGVSYEVSDELSSHRSLTQTGATLFIVDGGFLAVKKPATLIDLSHTIENGLITYKGLPAPVICDYLSRENSRKLYAEGTEFQIGKIEMVTNTGTYLDCPFHRYADGPDLSQVGLEAFTDLEGIMIHVPHTESLAITLNHVRDYAVKDRAVLLHTGWDAHWNTEAYYTHHPYVTAEAATYLRDAGAKLVGIDSHNIDDTTGNERPVHTILLGANCLIVEHLCNLSALPGSGFTFSAIPPKIKGVGTFPVRAMARVG